MELSGWDAATLVAKAITYAATLGAAGAVFFLAYSGSLLQESQRARIRRLSGVLAVSAAAICCARILLLAGSMSGDLAGMFDISLQRMILNHGEGRASGLRIAGLALTALALSSSPRALNYALLGAIIASTSFAWVGHIHALPHWYPGLVLSLHLTCAAFWLGALLPLLIVANDGTEPQVAAVVGRFGKLALTAVGLLLAAGAILLWTLIVDASTFWSSAYGVMMATKLLAAGMLLCIAAVNKLHLTPRLMNRDPKAVGLLRRSIRAEIVCAALILLITAAFTTLTGPPH
ncbi:MAG TPA: CopD family protein [Steroidobacteraceae bacterium]